MVQYSWTCSYCSRPQIVKDENESVAWHLLEVTDLNIGDVGLVTKAVACVNPECRKLSLEATLRQWPTRKVAGEDKLTKHLQYWRLLPASNAVPQPDYIPAPLVEDYHEACIIRDLSPKASAALSRRCLQGMIRDFCKIAKGTLDAAIKELRSRVDEGSAPAGITLESVEAIDQVRSIGNIGAHMEKDINLIIEVDPGEAEALTDLIEMLFSEWYVARHDRQQKLAQIAAIAADKKAKIAEGKAQQAQRLAQASEADAEPARDQGSSS